MVDRPPSLSISGVYIAFRLGRFAQRGVDLNGGECDVAAT
jgi:hypothetical protein